MVSALLHPRIAEELLSCRAPDSGQSTAADVPDTDVRLPIRTARICPSDRALPKFDFLSVVALTDYLIIQSLEALIYEGQSMRQDRMDEASTSTKAAQSRAQCDTGFARPIHSDIGKNNVAVNFSPFARTNQPTSQFNHALICLFTTP